jgi:hypothetical protein
MACARCPYTSNYQLLWQDAGDPELIAVMLRCCAGPELQIRRGSMVLSTEIFKTPLAVTARAEELRGARLSLSWLAAPGYTSAPEQSEK